MVIPVVGGAFNGWNEQWMGTKIGGAALGIRLTSMSLLFPPEGVLELCGGKSLPRPPDPSAGMGLDPQYPINIPVPGRSREGHPTIRPARPGVDSRVHGKEILVEYEKKEIIDNINSFFGYNCIGHITLKIVQEKIKTKKNFSKIKNQNKIEEKMKRVNNYELKNSLTNFLKAFNERNK